jgi:hypothetical protein
MTDILGLSVREIAQQVAQRTLSAEAVARAYIERRKQYCTHGNISTRSWRSGRRAASMSRAA